MMPLFLLALAPAQCYHLYAIHDQDQSDSQLFSYHLLTHTIQPLGPLYPGLDLEALATHPDTHLLYASSGTSQANLYLIDAITGALSLIGPLGADNVDSLAFDPIGQLWGWSTQGLLQIDPTTAQSTLVLPAGPYRFHELTWDLMGSQLYGVAEETAQRSALWSYTLEQPWQRLCDNLPKKVEGLTVRPDGLLMYTFHEDQQLQIHVYDATSCQTVEQASLTTPYHDIEALSWPTYLCQRSNQDALRTYLESLPGFQNLEISPQGVLTFTVNDKTYQGQLVEPLTPGIPTGAFTFTPIEDQNCDGHSDFQITYPSGDQQIVNMMGATPTPEVHITSPVEGATVDSSSTLVMGTYQGPPSTSIVVNGIPAWVDHGRFIANQVPIHHSTLIAQLFTLEGDTALTHRTVSNSSEPPVFQLIPSTFDSFAPLEVTFQAYFSRPSFTQLTVDVDSDGQPEWSEVSPETPFQYLYSQPGLYLVTAWATDKDGVTYQTQLGIQVHDEKEIKSLLKCSWQKMNTALAMGKQEEALRFVREEARPYYAAVWKALSPYLPEIVASYSPLMQLSLFETMAEFAVTRHVEGKTKTFLIYYSKGEDGVWRLAAM